MKKKYLLAVFLAFLFFILLPSLTEASSNVRWMSDEELTRYFERRNIDPYRVDFNYFRDTHLLIERYQNTGSNSYFVRDYDGNIIPNQKAYNKDPEYNFYNNAVNEGRLIANPCSNSLVLEVYSQIPDKMPYPSGCYLNYSYDVSKVYDQFQGDIVSHERFRPYAAIDKAPRGYSPGVINYYNKPRSNPNTVRFSTEVIVPKDPVDLHPVDLSVEEIKITPSPGRRNGSSTVQVRVKNDSDNTYSEGHIIYKWGKSSWGCQIVRNIPSTTNAPNGVWITLTGYNTEGCFGYPSTIADKFIADIREEETTFFAEINRDGFRNITERRYDSNGDEIPSYISGVYDNNSKQITVPMEVVDLEVIDFSIDPAPAQKSDTPIKEIKVTVRNNSNYRTIDSALNFDWGSEETGNSYCEMIGPLKPKEKKEITLGNGKNPKCNGESGKNQLFYTRYKEEQATIKKDFFVSISALEPENWEDDYSNNKKVKPIEVKGLNAFIQSVRIFDEDQTASDTNVTISTKVYNNMTKKIDAPCSTNNTHETCNGTQNKFIVDIINTDTGNTVTSITKDNAYTNIPAYDGYTVKVNTRLPYGKYKAVVKMPHYEYEYNFKDNEKEYPFEISKPFIKGLDCKANQSSYTNDKFNRFCIGIYPKQPSTLTENGEGMFSYVIYRLLPSPMPSYTFGKITNDSMDQTIVLNEENTNSNGELKSFIRHSDEKQPGTDLYKYRGRMFAKEIKFDIQILDPKGNTVPSSVGTLNYTLPSDCYDPYALDYEQKCRTIDFYIGMNPSGDIGKYNKEPAKKDKTKFKNPGKYTYKIEARENQVYRYQTITQNQMYKKDGTPLPPGYNWSNPVWYDGTISSPFKSPSNFESYRQPASHFGYSEWTEKNDLYKFYFPFPVTGISTGSGSN